MNNVNGLIRQVKSLSGRFWVLNFIQMFEKMAYVIVLLQMPIYLAQKDVAGGLYLDQTIKGYIFFVWAIIQRLTPFFTGGFTDKTGYKKTLFISFVIITLSYIVLGTQKEFILFLFGIMLLGFGSGIFLPALQASLTNTLNKENESTGWGMYFMLLNLGVFFSPAISKYLKDISWQWVFFGSAGIFLINYLILAFIKLPKNVIEVSDSKVITNIFKDFFKKEVFTFVLIMSGFVIIYMQFYETFPNFFVDWVNTQSFVEYFHLPDFMTAKSIYGTRLSYEWIGIINSGMIILAVVPVSWLMSKFLRINVLIIGIILATIGLFISGSGMSGWISTGGILIYTLGELITNPKFTEQMNHLAPEGKKAQYMSYLNISFAIGFGVSALLGGYMYNYFGEKAYLASKYLEQNYGIFNTPLTESMNVLTEKLGISPLQTSELLWNNYNPYLIWLPFILLGLMSAAGLIYYKRKFK